MWISIQIQSDLRKKNKNIVYSRISTRRKSVKPRKVEHIPTIRGSTFFHGDNSISQLDCEKFFRLDIFPPSGDPA